LESVSVLLPLFSLLLLFFSSDTTIEEDLETIEGEWNYWNEDA
jgi:hypothetical protein